MREETHPDAMIGAFARRCAGAPAAAAMKFTEDEARPSRCGDEEIAEGKTVRAVAAETSGREAVRRARASLDISWGGGRQTQRGREQDAWVLGAKDFVWIRPIRACAPRVRRTRKSGCNVTNSNEKWKKGIQFRFKGVPCSLGF